MKKSKCQFKNAHQLAIIPPAFRRPVDTTRTNQLTMHSLPQFLPATITFFLALALLVYTTNMLALLYVGPFFLLLVLALAIENCARTTFVPKSFKHMFALNTTSIHFFLTVSSILCGVETVLRYQEIEAFYTNDGVFPISLYNALCYELGVCDFDYKGGDSAILTKTDHCLHLSSGDVTFQRLLFLFTFSLAVWSAYKPKTWCLASLYLLLSSMHRRNHFINDKGSMTLRVMLLWSTLLSFDLNTETTAVDAAGNKKQNNNHWFFNPSTKSAASASSVGFIFQVGMIYWFSALYKYAPSADDSWSSGRALDVALNFKQYSTPLGRMILSMPPIVRVVLTHASGVLESVGPFIFMAPFYTSFFRGLGVLSFVSFHLGIGSTMNLGVFPIYSCMLFLPLIPKEWWVLVGWNSDRSREESSGGSGGSGGRGGRGGRGGSGVGRDGGAVAPSAQPVLTLADAGDITGRNDVPESTIGGETTCIVCMVHPKSHLAVPCGHQSVCGICAERMQCCPYCRAPVQQWVHARVV